MTENKAIDIFSHQNGEIVYIETPEGIKKRIFCDGKLYEQNPLYEFMVLIINKKDEENKNLKSILNKLLDNGTCYSSAIELDFRFDGEKWEKDARELTGNYLEDSK